jgi:uncharacterized Zn-binding protein involved in type VI secretion
MGAPNVVDGATLMCTFGAGVGNLVVLPINRVTVEGRPAATVADAVPLLNIRPMGLCMSLANPAVAAATAAALGVLTPQACSPVTAAWMPGTPRTTIGGRPALTLGSQCRCAFGGVITVVQPGAMRTTTG